MFSPLLCIYRLVEPFALLRIPLLSLELAWCSRNFYVSKTQGDSKHSDFRRYPLIGSQPNADSAEGYLRHGLDHQELVN